MKQVLLLFLIILPIYGLLYVGWIFSPGYKDAQQQMKLQALEILSKTYYLSPNAVRDIDRAKLMKYFDITDDDINPKKIFERMLESQ